MVILRKSKLFTTPKEKRKYKVYRRNSKAPTYSSPGGNEESRDWGEEHPDE